MKAETISTLGVRVNVNRPTSFQECKELGAANEEAIVSRAWDYIKAHIWLGEFRDKYVEALAKKTGIAREQYNQGKDEKGNDIIVDEKEAVYADRVYELAGLAQSEYNNLAQEVANSLPVSFAVKERVAGPKAVPKTYLALAEDFIKANGQDVANRLAAKLTTLVGFEVSAETSEGLARGIWQNELRKAREEAAQKQAEYAAMVS